MSDRIQISYKIDDISSMIAALFKTSRRINLSGEDVVVIPEPLFDHLFPYILNLINKEK